MKVVFFGTPQVAVPALEALVRDDDIDVIAVVTNPDRPRGRRRTPVASPVKSTAVALGLPVLQPERPGDLTDDLRALEPDACAVVAYGSLLPREILEVPPLGFVNLHFSLLPRWRGAAPVQHAVRHGDRVTGITVFQLDEGMDTGPILEQRETPIGGEESAGELLDRLTLLGAPALVEGLRRLAAGDRPEPQSDDGATLAPKIHPKDLEIDWQESARRIVDLVRSAAPTPGARTRFRGRQLKVLRAGTVRCDDRDCRPGEILGVGREGPLVGSGQPGEAVELRTVQPEGKARMAGGAFVNGYAPASGEELGDEAPPGAEAGRSDR